MKRGIKAFQILERRAKVAALRCQGLTYIEIAVKLGMPYTRVSEMTICRDCKAIQAQWKEEAVRSYETKKAEQLAKLQNLERELWQAWERSKMDSNYFAEYHIRGGERGPTNPNIVRTTTKKESRDGNPAFTGQILTCIRDQSEMLGIIAKPGETSTAPPLVGFRIFEPEGDAARPGPEPAQAPAGANNGEATQAS